MTKEQIDYSIRTGRLKLSSSEKLSYHFAAVCWFLVPAFFVMFEIIGPFRGIPMNFGRVKWFIIIPLLPGILCFLIQWKRLKFKSIETKLRRGEIDVIIEKVAKELEWYQYLVGEKVIVAKAQYGFRGNWGEHITILFDKNRVLIKSIVDPDKQTAITSFGRNKRNENKLIEAIKEANT